MGSEANSFLDYIKTRIEYRKSRLWERANVSASKLFENQHFRAGRFAAAFPLYSGAA
jgi:hypothetical protein